MKRLSILFSLLLTAVMLFAVPAKPVWQVMTLADGTTVKVIRCGDENFHYFKSADGAFYLRTAGNMLREVTPDEIVELWENAPRRIVSAERRAVRAARHTDKVAAGGAMRAPIKTDGFNKAATIYNDSVERRGLVIMASFSDLDFRDGNAYREWDDILNKDGYSEHGAAGSVHDYFLDQSGGKFNLKFDVMGPVKLSKGHYYYGTNGKGGDLDIHMAELIDEATAAVDSMVDFRDYDWDGDGEVDQVFILYAGCGEHGSGNPNDSLIWPHEYWLQYYDGYEKGITRDGVVLNTYACGSELDGNEKDLFKIQSGLGVFCHEFSHCLGLPDLYDTRTGLDDMLGYWDMLSLGCYNNGGWTPPNYSAYEREFCGWQQPVVLNERASITNMAALGDGGQTYRVNNDCADTTRIEYYLIENRQQTGWDRFLPGKNIIITQIYYRKTYWDSNAVNTFGMNGVAIIPASNVYDADKNVSYPYYNSLTGTFNDELTDRSVPAAKMNRKNKNGVYYMNKPITEIAVVDGVGSFEFMKSTEWNIDTGIENITGDKGGNGASNAIVYGRPAVIYDAQGRIVNRTDNFQGIDNLKNGLYIIKGMDGGSVKIVK